MLRIKSAVDLASFNKLHAFMKKITKGFEANRPLVFTEEELRKFFIEAPDDIYLFLKVVVICGVFGSCRRYELCDLRISDIVREGTALIIHIRPSKSDKGRKFIVVDHSGIPYVQLFNKYLSLRPHNVATERVFLKYTNGKCIKQVVGINSFGRCPSRVARFLNLPNPEKYTGHAFRRTSETIMANSGMRAYKRRRQVAWSSSADAVGYTEEPAVHKLKVSETVANGESTSSVYANSVMISDGRY